MRTKREATVLSIELPKLTRRGYVYLQFKYQDDMVAARDVLMAFELRTRGTTRGASSSMRITCDAWELVKIALEPWFDVKGWPNAQADI